MESIGSARYGTSMTYSILLATLLALGMLAILPITAHATQYSQVSIVTLNSSGLDISGYYVSLWQNGIQISSCFSTCAFTVQNDVVYQVAVGNYGGECFSYWQPNNSTDTFLTFDINSTASFSLTYSAVYASCSTGTSQLTIASENTLGSQISGYYTILNESGSIQATGYTPTNFTVDNGVTYTVQVDNYGTCNFSQWADNGNTSPTRSVTISSNITYTAVYDCGQPGVGITSIDQNGNPISGYYVLLCNPSTSFYGNGSNTCNSSAASSELSSGFTPVTFSNFGYSAGQQVGIEAESYGGCTFNYWNGTGSVSDMDFVTVTNPPTTYTAVYYCGSSSPSGTSTINVSTVDGSGGQISGYYIALMQGGTQISSCFSSCSFTVSNGQSYQVVAEGYGSESFSHWQNDQSTGAETVNVPSASTTFSLTAVYSP